MPALMSGKSTRRSGTFGECALSGRNAHVPCPCPCHGAVSRTEAGRARLAEGHGHVYVYVEISPSLGRAPGAPAISRAHRLSDAARSKIRSRGRRRHTRSGDRGPERHGSDSKLAARRLTRIDVETFDKARGSLYRERRSRGRLARPTTAAACRSRTFTRTRSTCRLTASLSCVARASASRILFDVCGRTGATTLGRRAGERAWYW